MNGFSHFHLFPGLHMTAHTWKPSHPVAGFTTWNLGGGGIWLQAWSPQGPVLSLASSHSLPG